MTRTTASSADEIYSRHSCVARVGDPQAVPAISAYDGLLVAPGIDGMRGEAIGPWLRVAVERIRRSYEIEEIYALVDRPTGRAEFFEPLCNEHFGRTGEVVIVARQRHPHHMPRVVGIMLAKDEADVIGDVVTSLRPHLDALYYSAGDEATAEALHMTLWAQGVGGEPARDGARQALLETARAEALAAGDRRPMWVMVVQGDEIYHDDLSHHIRLAQLERASVMTCQVATFLLHESQQTAVTGKIDRQHTEAWYWSQPLAQRLTHYIWDFGEHAGFVDFPWVRYDPSEHMRAHPHGLYPGRYATARPVRKHYPFRSPKQATARIADRLASGWQPHYKNYEKVFMGEVAAGRPVKRYHGWFGEAERTDGIW